MRIVMLALVSVSLLACGQEQATLAPNGPQFDWMNNPDNGNLRITRHGIDFDVSWSDPRSGLRATHSTYSLGTEPGCGPGGVLDPIDIQDVGLPDFIDFYRTRFRTNAKGEVWIVISDTNEPGDCGGYALVAEGMGTLHFTDNDRFAFYPVGGGIRPNNNAYGYMAEGRLTGVSGEAMQYSGHLHVTWDPQTPGGKIIVENAQVGIH